MTARTTRIVLLASLFALATSLAGFAQAPCGVANQIYCQPWDGGANLYGSQNDTVSGFGNFATTYDAFVLNKGTDYWDVESFHFVGGYFNPPAQGPITAFTLTLYPDVNGAPDILNPIATGSFTSFSETFLGNVSGFPIYMYSLYFQSFDMYPGTYFASVVPDLGFPPQWGWATSAGGQGIGYQCFFGTCGGTGTSFALAVDGRPVPEPGTLIMLGTGILGLAGSLRRKLL
jgi:PEP-CTERM motif